jgi:hypothetical protein
MGLGRVLGELQLLVRLQRELTRAELITLTGIESDPLPRQNYEICGHIFATSTISF